MEAELSLDDTLRSDSCRPLASLLRAKQGDGQDDIEARQIQPGIACSKAVGSGAAGFVVDDGDESALSVNPTLLIVSPPSATPEDFVPPVTSPASSDDIDAQPSPGSGDVHTLDAFSTRTQSVTHPLDLRVTGTFDLTIPSPSDATLSLENDKAECSNCGITNTPLWRRGRKGEPICNACGLYLRAHHTSRPQYMYKNSRLGDRNEYIKRKRPVVIAGSKSVQCYNCLATKTPVWRKGVQGEMLCNACGLYYRNHGSARPISLKYDMAGRRNRAPEHPATKSMGLHRSNGSKDLPDACADRDLSPTTRLVPSPLRESVTDGMSSQDHILTEIHTDAMEFDTPQIIATISYGAQHSADIYNSESDVTPSTPALPSECPSPRGDSNDHCGASFKQSHSCLLCSASTCTCYHDSMSSRSSIPSSVEASVTPQDVLDANGFAHTASTTGSLSIQNISSPRRPASTDPTSASSSMPSDFTYYSDWDYDMYSMSNDVLWNTPIPHEHQYLSAVDSNNPDFSHTIFPQM